MDGKRRRFHSDQSRMILLRAGAFLEGRVLLGVCLATRPLEFMLRFQGDVTLVVAPLKGAAGADSLWHLSYRGQYLGLLAGRRLQYRKSLRSPLRAVTAAPIELAF